MRTALKPLCMLALGAALTGLGVHSAAALSITPISQGTQPGGMIVSVVQITFNPGDVVPWHYHTGHGWGTVVSGSLTEDEGCDKPLSTLAAGTSFAEIPGKVHRVFNFGTTPAIMTFVVIYPGCDKATIFVTGPRCEGNSGKSHLEKIPECDEDGDRTEKE